MKGNISQRQLLAQFRCVEFVEITQTTSRHTAGIDYAQSAVKNDPTKLSTEQLT